MLPDHLLDEINSYLSIYYCNYGNVEGEWKTAMKEICVEYHKEVRLWYMIIDEDEDGAWKRKGGLYDNMLDHDLDLIGYRGEWRYYIPYDRFIVYCKIGWNRFNNRIPYILPWLSHDIYLREISNISRPCMGDFPLIPENYWYTYPTMDDLKKVL